MPSSSRFHGPQRRLVLAFDIGTTFSGISYSILDPGQIPEVKGVTKFPSQENHSGSSKIPSVIYYDASGKVRAVGAEATADAMYETAEEENLIMAEWFKLHLRPKAKENEDLTDQIPPLPLNKTVIDIFADFLRYLLACAKSYIQTTHPNGSDLWNSVMGDIEFILSHPNGWEGAEQSQMRKAAVLARLIPDNTSGHTRLSFVTEGEASLHFAIRHGLPEGAIRNGEGVMIVDAGGGTIDVSSYAKQARTTEDTFPEIAVPQCYFHGSVFVSINARIFLEKMLSESPYIADIEHIVRCFDNTTKLRFRDDRDAQFVRFASAKDNDPGCGIRFGQLKLAGSDTASFFQPSLECIVNAVLDQRQTARKPISHVVFVGGFAANDWLYNQMNARLVPYGLTILVPNNHVNKAVSDGAVLSYLNHSVRNRIAKFSYGVKMNVHFDANNSEHQQRVVHSFVCEVDGGRKLEGGFDVILFKDTEVEETKEFKKPYVRCSKTRSELQGPTSVAVHCYRGASMNPRWTDTDPNHYRRIGILKADLSCLPPEIKVNKVTQENYFRVDYSVILFFGLTELKGQVAWLENGVEKRSPATIIYEP
ncbi:hypothetical protein GALMADRAFT_103100 [Galerina marginata CBS 339.88]|uniref:Uncharacterized protein n=1 Tax=Galerina marginata (strain CBS 339.88) TaxID=685588 RepID=A0A067SL08_GALM3|nr:hypothetical protein GALMADRAFT_103100 [Galerina marginata CBS 339.88]